MKKLILQQAATGRGVFAGEEIRAGEEILTFAGRRMTRREIPPLRGQEEDYYLQVDDDVFIGPSGEMDDYVNHSCDPNGGVVFADDSVKLIAIRDITPGEEICFDYSTTTHNPVVVMVCSCGSTMCRGTVDSFVLLPAEVQARYMGLGVVPEFIKQRAVPSRPAGRHPVASRYNPPRRGVGETRTGVAHIEAGCPADREIDADAGRRR